MFFIARMVAAMLTGSCGSGRTTPPCDRMDSPMPAAPGSGADGELTAPDAKRCPPLPSTTESWRAALRRSNEVAAAGWDFLDDWSAGDETVDDDDHRDHQQQVDQAATNVHDEESENPENEQNYRDGPKNDGILARSELHPTRQKN